VKEQSAGAEYDIWKMTKCYRTSRLAIITILISYTRKGRPVVRNVTIFQMLSDVL